MARERRWGAPSPPQRASHRLWSQKWNPTAGEPFHFWTHRPAAENFRRWVPAAAEHGAKDVLRYPSELPPLTGRDLFDTRGLDDATVTDWLMRPPLTRLMGSNFGPRAGREVALSHQPEPAEDQCDGGDHGSERQRSRSWRASIREPVRHQLARVRHGRPEQCERLPVAATKSREGTA